MSATLVFDIGPDGVVRYIHSTAAVAVARAAGLGRPTIRRGSHVEFDNEAQAWFADMSPLGVDTRLGPYETREGALAEEHAWLLEHMPALLCGACREPADTPPAGEDRV